MTFLIKYDFDLLSLLKKGKGGNREIISIISLFHKTNTENRSLSTCLDLGQ